MSAAMTRTDIRGQLAGAHVAATMAEDIYMACEHGETDDCEHQRASVAADAEVERLQVLLRDPATPGLRTFVLTEDGEQYDKRDFASAAEALAAVEAAVDGSNYDTSDATTMWIDVRVWCDETGESDSSTVQVDPEEPACDAGDHEWEAWPLGDEFGGARGHGGGVIFTECCGTCGCRRVTDTWAQRPDTGEQGLTSVTYTPGHYLDDEAFIAARAESAAAE